MHLNSLAMFAVYITKIETNRLRGGKLLNRVINSTRIILTWLNGEHGHIRRFKVSGRRRIRFAFT